ncbi:MAG: hypothetical protein FWH20_10165 [Oscillospiraceae bacterium]|nr:hypothetical protein [Oscillospiraceae bacterium]
MILEDNNCWVHNKNNHYIDGEFEVWRSGNTGKTMPIKKDNNADYDEKELNKIFQLAGIKRRVFHG